MALAVKQKKPADTAALLAEARAGLAAIEAKERELDAKRLELEPELAVKQDIEFAASRKDAERRVALLEEKAAAEQKARQVKAQGELIERVEKKFAESDQAGERLAAHLAAAVGEFKKLVATRSAAQIGWPWQASDAAGCLFGRWLAAAISGELYRLSGTPFATDDAAQFAFPGSQCPSVSDPRPESIAPLAEKLKESSGYASRQMREAPVRTLPVAAPVEPKPLALPAKSAEPQKADAKPGPAGVRTNPQAEYLFRVDFVHLKTREVRTEEIALGPAEIEETFLDGIGPTGPRGKEIALRSASARVPADFVYLAQPNSVRFDMGRLVESMNKE
jgi:hypothetical protein